MVVALRGGVSVEGCALAGERGWVALAVSHGVYSAGVLKNSLRLGLFGAPAHFWPTRLIPEPNKQTG